MPRTPMTPAAAQANAKFHADQSAAAAETVAAILSGTWTGPDNKRAAALHDAAKVLEAAGCYIRRQNAKGLLAP